MTDQPMAGGGDGGRILLTGATSGIGLATARLLAPRADALVLQGPEPLDDVADTVAGLDARRPNGGSLTYVQADYRRLPEVERLADEVLARTPHLDVVINNAAIPARRTARCRRTATS
jgi:NAD(P)-dependent dehydrogenase (short-subunit alcohol dehydrogenase family)